MNIVVTGGSGFVGSHLVERLLNEGHQVIVLDNYVTGRRENLDHLSNNPRLTVIQHDCTLPFFHYVEHAQIDRVYNLASPASPKGYGMYPIETLRVNAEGTFNALEVARLHGARFVQASTSEVYGDPMVHPQPETYWGNVNSIGIRSCYDEGKRFGESMVMEYWRQLGVDARIARIFNTYGPRNQPTDGRVVPSFCVQAIGGDPITVYGSGYQTRSFCYVEDMVEGLILLMETDNIGGEVVNLGNPTEYTILRFAERIIELSGSSSPIVYEPLPQDDPRQRKPDISKAYELLGWSPRVDLDEGVLRTLKHFSELQIGVIPDQLSAAD